MLSYQDYGPSTHDLLAQRGYINLLNEFAIIHLAICYLPERFVWQNWERDVHRILYIYYMVAFVDFAFEITFGCFMMLMTVTAINFY